MNWLQFLQHYKHYIWPQGVVSVLSIVICIAISSERMLTLAAVLIGSGLGVLIGDGIRMYPGNEK